MKIVIAPDSFKGSLSALEICRHLEIGVRKITPDVQCILLPVADGGEGTIEALVVGAGGTKAAFEVVGPLGTPVHAEVGILADGTGVVEMAAASGLPLVPADKRDPRLTTTYGTGQLIRHLLDRGCRRILLGIGGSATNDGGVGMAQALGWSFLDAGGRELVPGGGALSALDRIDRSKVDARLADCEFVIASDVTNPLVGAQGASVVYGPQKGADPATVTLLDANLSRLADVIELDLGLKLHHVPGTGAAGGLGAGLMAFCGAQMGSGIDTILDAVGFSKALEGADLVLTGEGRIDSQSVFGKVPVGVATRAKMVSNGKVPVVAIVGGMGPGADAVYAYGVDAILSICDGPMSLETALGRTGELLEAAAERVMRLMNLGKKA